MANSILCSVSGCVKKSLAKGLCKSHYERNRKHGDPLGGFFPLQTCKIDGCNGKHASNGLCGKHYMRLRRYGDPLVEFEVTPPGVAISWLKEHANYADVDTCLIWPFARRRGGYGSMRVNGQYIGAHQMMCRYTHGEPDEERTHVAHSCGNSTCVNPHHLRWATRPENEADKLKHGTHNRGERHGRVKLTESDVREIRALRGSMKQKAIAEKFEVSQSAVSFIQSRKLWSWLD